MAKLIFEGPNPSFSHAGSRYVLGEDPRKNDDGSYDVPDDQAEYLISTRKFSYAAEGKAKAKGRVTIGGRGRPKPAEGQDIPAPTPAGAPAFPANGFESKHAAEEFGRAHLSFEVDKRKALKTINNELFALYTEKYVKPAEQVEAERPSDLGFDDDDGEIDTARNVVVMDPNGGGDLDEED